MRAAIHTCAWLLAILCLTAFGGCRRVTIISFHTDVVSATPITKLVVNLHGTAMKHSEELHGLDEQLGLYNLPDDHITISAFGCSPDGYIILINDKPAGMYTIVADAVLVPMVAFADIDQRITCPVVESDGGVSGEPSGAGGAAGSGSGGSGGNDAGTGGAGTDGGADGGLGGMPGSGGMDGGGDATGGAGQGGSDGGTCVIPSGPAQGPTSVTPTAACVDYCNQIIGSADGGSPLCQGAYESIDQCQQYCTRVAWDPGSLMDMKDSMGCRLYSLNDAQVFALTGMSADMIRRDCAAAGPSGGSGPESCGMPTQPRAMCLTFCNAWTKICTGDASSCLTACQSTPVTEPACRFPWLVRAATDQRYCALVDFAGSCLPPGC